jgi:hypothetical protein
LDSALSSYFVASERSVSDYTITEVKVDHQRDSIDDRQNIVGVDTPPQPRVRPSSPASLPAKPHDDSAASQNASPIRDAGVPIRQDNTAAADQARPSSRAQPARQDQTEDDTPAMRSRYPLDRTGISQAVKSILPDIKDCYEQWLKINPGIGGAMKVNVSIDIDPEDPSKGKVVDAMVLLAHLLQRFACLSVEKPRAVSRHEQESRY